MDVHDVLGISHRNPVQNAQVSNQAVPWLPKVRGKHQVSKEKGPWLFRVYTGLYHLVMWGWFHTPIWRIPIKQQCFSFASKAGFVLSKIKMVGNCMANFPHGPTGHKWHSFSPRGKARFGPPKVDSFQGVSHGWLETASCEKPCHPWDDCMYIFLHENPSKSTIHVGKCTIVPWMAWV